jgi:hypothetical protein
MQETVPEKPAYLGIEFSAGILEQSMGARNRVGLGLSYQPEGIHRLAGIVSLESIPGLLKHLKIPSLFSSVYI